MILLKKQFDNFRTAKQTIMKINFSKAYQSLQCDERMPRKIKKKILGKRMSNGKLKQLLKTVQIISQAKTMHENPVIKPYTFCPHCGCTGMIGSGNMTTYPEHWETFKCIRCNKIVGYIDNSPFSHALEYPDFNYDPTF